MVIKQRPTSVAGGKSIGGIVFGVCPIISAMEGIYFFGENLRWNLGWSNPNQGGAFVAMLIPWFWAIGGRVVFRRAGGVNLFQNSLRCDFAATVILISELVVWFLLCKTYSRGALVAVVGSGVLFFLWNCWSSGFLPVIRRNDSIKSDLLHNRRWRIALMRGVRVTSVGALLFATGFFSRIEPGFVSQDASAGNRLTLWKGGLQMIAEAPWGGWGEDQSGKGFMHWFQPLEANEQYAGMVNSYLHVGVEYGLPMLAVVMTLAVGLVMFSFFSNSQKSDVSAVSLPQGVSATVLMRYAMAGAGCSLAVFLMANVFSTLWVFGGLWWVPALDALIILAIGGISLRSKFFRGFGSVLAVAMAFSVVAVLALFVTGKTIKSDLQVSFDSNDNLVVINAEGKRRMLFIPEASVLGDSWGKEIRRLAATDQYQEYVIETPFGGAVDDGGIPKSRPDAIVACGSEFPAGFSTLVKNPDALLILVHPVGKPIIPEGTNGRVSLILPMLDTTGGAGRWRALGKRKGWEISVSPGVGQDVRLAWPEVLVTEG